jgi:D-sedoheptulose 7-phosphate isomerase
MGSAPTGAAVAGPRIAASLEAISSLSAEVERIERIADLVADRLADGGTVFTAGNGGSAAEALHLAEELVGRYRTNRVPLRAMCLAADPTALTCIANDFGFEQVFARQVAALAGPLDCLILFSTSGRSPNLAAAAVAARAKGATVIGLLGGDGGTLLPQCHEAVVVRARDSAACQEAHQVLLHIVCERLERPLRPA